MRRKPLVEVPPLEEIQVTPSSSVLEGLRARVIGQEDALAKIAEYVEVYQAGLNLPGRPAGIFALLGPSGVGKTATVEALAEVLHGDHKKYIRLDCGEFQLDHDISKIQGSNPGYLGHGQTQPAITQERLTSVTSDRCSVSILLLDEIEKASSSVHQLFLGVLDKARLVLGDNRPVNFERTMIFMTGNVGSREMVKANSSNPFTFNNAQSSSKPDTRGIGQRAMEREFPPEFCNRVDVVSVYEPLTREQLSMILDLELGRLRDFIVYRLAEKAPILIFMPSAKEFLLERGTSAKFGARELKRVLFKYVTHPLAKMVNSNTIQGRQVVVTCGKGKDELTFETNTLATAPTQAAA